MDMRRERSFFGVKQIWPIFLWTKCENCGMEFKNEFGLKIYEKQCPGGAIYLCASCSVQIGDLDEVICEGAAGGLVLHKPIDTNKPPNRDREENYE